MDAMDSKTQRFNPSRLLCDHCSSLRSSDDFQAFIMDKLITHVAAANVEDSFTALAMTWPLWESKTHPQARPPFSLLLLLSVTLDSIVALVVCNCCHSCGLCCATWSHRQLSLLLLWQGRRFWFQSPLQCVLHQNPPKSGKFHFDYNGDYETERVLIMSGEATLTPDDGSEEILIGKGDQVEIIMDPPTLTASSTIV